MPKIIITIPEILKLLSEINPHKASGPDNILACVLKETASEIAPMLTHLFQQSLNTGVIPPEWKQAYVTPIYKKGNKANPKNKFWRSSNVNTDLNWSLKVKLSQWSVLLVRHWKHLRFLYLLYLIVGTLCSATKVC